MKAPRWLVVFSLLAVLCGTSAAHEGPLADEDAEWGVAMDRGYQAQSQEPLLAFLNAWHADSKPVAADILRKKPAFERDVYGIFGVLCKPDERIYRNTAFVVIQNEITVVLVDADLRAAYSSPDVDGGSPHKSDMLDKTRTSRYVVKDFRPPLKIEGKKVLFTQDKYLYHLVGFLAQNKNPSELMERQRYRGEDNTSKESRARAEYVSRALKVVPGHWGRGWLFNTYPTVSTVYLDAASKHAIVNYRAPFYRFAEALLEKNADNTWTVVSTRIVATE